MNQETTAYVINVTAALTVMLIAWVMKMLYVTIKARIKSIKGIASQASKRILPPALRAAVYAFMFWFFITQLRVLIDQPGPPSRIDTLVIAFWTSWMVLVFLKMLGDFGQNDE